MSHLRVFTLTTAFSLSIAVVLWVLAVAEPLWLSIAVSCCIGYSVFGAHELLHPRFAERWGTLITGSIATVLGVLFALAVIAGVAYAVDFRSVLLDGATLMLGLFFGVIGTMFFLNHSRLHEMQAALAAAELTRLDQEKHLTATHLKLLQAQIEPHFLFNTLSNVVGMVRDNPEGAQDTLVQLTKLLRASLSRTRESNTTLAEELNIVEAYLKIQQIRMGKRLCFEINCARYLGSQPLPPLVLQPLVENAVKHGIEPSEAGGSITVDASLDAEQLHISVVDTGIGLDASATSEVTGTGLTNIRQRLAALYNGAATLLIQPTVPTGVTVKLSLPLANTA
jgi:sensor histidine kinase YesM